MFNKKDFTSVESVMILETIKNTASKRLAAKVLNISLETLDKYVHGLEEDLGRELVVTNGRGCRLTAVGEKLVESADCLKHCLENIYAAREEEKEMKGEVHIAYDQNICGKLHIEAINGLVSEYPEITLCIDYFNNESDLENMRYDISLGYNIPKGEDIVIIESKEIPCKFFASTDYLRLHPYPKNLDDLFANHRLIVRRDNWKSMAAREKWRDKPNQGIFFTNSTFIMNDIAVHNGGIGIMPYYYDKMERNLVRLDNLECPTVHTLYLISHKNRKDIPKVRAVLNSYKNLIKKL